jgi:hypothetical protein
MRTYFTMVGFAIMFGLAGCKSPSPQESLPPVHITQDQFSGRQFSLVSSRQVEWYWFSDDGHVSATYGKKHGPMIAPLFYWQIADGDTLVIRDSPNGTGSIKRSYQFGVITNSMAVTVDGKRFEIQ